MEIVRLWEEGGSGKREEGEAGISKECERRGIWKREGVGRDRDKKRSEGTGVHGRVYLTVN